MGINSFFRPLVRTLLVESCEQSIIKIDVNILQYAYLASPYIHIDDARP